MISPRASWAVFALPLLTLATACGGGSGPDADPTIASGDGGSRGPGGGMPGGGDGGPGRECNGPSDCASGVCEPASGTCAAPTPKDGVKNGDETGVDCGGPTAPKCEAGQGCKVHADCRSDGCAFDGTCASHPSCTKLEGGYTCGPQDGTARQADCCASSPVAGFVVDEFLVTAGRMRTFLDRLGGDVRAWASKLSAAQWDQAMTAGLPASWDEANTQLGPFYGKRSCQTGYETGHTFWTPPSFGDTKDFPREVLDTKALNCVPWALLSAFCVWDGGHLAREAELVAAYTNGGTTAYPWGALGSYTTDANPSVHAVQQWAYETPNPPPDARRNPETGAYLDIAFRIAPPGRRPAGYNATGHADLVGNLLEWVGDLDRQLIWSGSFEAHGAEADKFTPAANDPLMVRTPDPPSPLAPGLPPNQPWRWGGNLGTGRPDDTTGSISSMGYYAIGGRCARAK